MTVLFESATIFFKRNFTIIIFRPYFLEMKLNKTTSGHTSTSNPVVQSSPEMEVIVVQDLSDNPTTPTNVDRLDWIFIVFFILAFLLIVAVVCR